MKKAPGKMKVICIDGAKRPKYYLPNSPEVYEGETYIVTDSWLGIFTGIPYYSLEGFPCKRGVTGFHQDRFAVVSEIDETTFPRNYQKEPML